MRKVKKRKLLYNGGVISSTLGMGSLLSSTLFCKDPMYSISALVGSGLVGVGLLLMSSNSQNMEEETKKEDEEITNLNFDDQLLSLDLDSIKKREEEIKAIEDYYNKNIESNTDALNYLIKKNLLKEKLILNSSTTSYHTTNEAEKVDSEVTLEALFKLEYDRKYVMFRREAIEEYEKNKKKKNCKIIKFARK